VSFAGLQPIALDWHQHEQGRDERRRSARQVTPEAYEVIETLWVSENRQTTFMAEVAVIDMARLGAKNGSLMQQSGIVGELYEQPDLERQHEAQRP
jgi:hypothetical protein